MIIEKLSYTQTALVCFFVAASIICLAAGITVLQPDTSLSVIWTIKPDAFADLIALRPWSGIGFMLLSVIMALAAWGCWRRRSWGWRLVVAIFTANGLGDLGQIFSGRIFEGAIGVTVALAIIFWLTRQKVKSAFR